jgi:hypothetical protein
MRVSYEIVVDCPKCNVRVKAASVAFVLEPEVGDIGYFLVSCPSCRNPIFCQAWSIQDELDSYSWNTAERLWPQASNRQLSSAIPVLAAEDIRDAQKCLHNGIVSAAVVLCGRALERLIHDKTDEKTIARGLRALREKGIIDQKLFEWADALRQERNLGAHATEKKISRENAEDTIDFVLAIYDYVYTLTEKYERFMQRKAGS